MKMKFVRHRRTFIFKTTKEMLQFLSMMTF